MHLAQVIAEASSVVAAGAPLAAKGTAAVSIQAVDMMHVPQQQPQSARISAGASSRLANGAASVDNISEANQIMELPVDDNISEAGNQIIEILVDELFYTQRSCSGRFTRGESFDTLINQLDAGDVDVTTTDLLLLQAVQVHYSRQEPPCNLCMQSLYAIFVSNLCRQLADDDKS